MAEVIIRGMNKKYPNGYEAVKNVNLEVKDQEFMVLVGPSGCGKTTTLRMIAGLEEISSGELFIGETFVNDIEPKDRDIAMVFQNYALYPHMSVYDNMAFGLKLRKKKKEEINKMVNKAAAILGIENLLDRKPKQLSGGQRQRVALGRAIVRNPKVFLMDEPLSNLDAKLRVQMRAELIKLHRDLKTTFIYVTHDQVEAMTMGTRICVMNEGKIQQVADPNTIYKRPANKFVAGFIGIPQMNFFDGEVLEENNKIYLKICDVKNLVDEKLTARIKEKNYINKKVTIGVRPENLKLISKEEVGICGIIELTENLGSEVYFYIKFNEQNLIIRAERDVEGKIGDYVKIGLPKEDIHLFDKDSGISILQ